MNTDHKLKMEARDPRAEFRSRQDLLQRAGKILEDSPSLLTDGELVARLNAHWVNQPLGATSIQHAAWLVETLRAKTVPATIVLERVISGAKLDQALAEAQEDLRRSFYPGEPEFRTGISYATLAGQEARELQGSTVAGRAMLIDCRSMSSRSIRKAAEAAAFKQTRPEFYGQPVVVLGEGIDLDEFNLIVHLELTRTRNYSHEIPAADVEAAEQALIKQSAGPLRPENSASEVRWALSGKTLQTVSDAAKSIAPAQATTIRPATP